MKFQQWLEGSLKDVSSRAKYAHEFRTIRTGNDSTATFQRDGKGQIVGFTVYDLQSGGLSVSQALTSNKLDRDTGWIKGLPNREYYIVIMGE